MAAKFEMRHKQHAISEFSATLRFFNAVSASAFAAVRSRAGIEAERLELPAPIKQQTIRFGIGKAADLSKLQAIAPPKTLEGFGFQSFSRNGQVDTSILCEPDNLTFTVAEYPGWQIILPEICQTFSAIGREYLAEVPAVKGFGLQYVNEFTSADAGLISCKELFKESRWLAEFWRDHTDLWHSHCGIFIPINAASRYLINVNFDVNLRNKPESNVKHTFVRVTISVHLNYDIAGEQPLVVDSEGIGPAITDNMTRSHMLEKDILREVFSDEYLDLMGAQNG